MVRPLDLMTNDSDDFVNLDETRQLASDGIDKNARYDKKRFEKTKVNVKVFSR